MPKSSASSTRSDGTESAPGRSNAPAITATASKSPTNPPASATIAHPASTTAPSLPEQRDQLKLRGIASWAGTVYVAFAIDVFSRAIVGWKASMSKETDLVLDTIEQGLHERDYRHFDGQFKLVHHSDAGSQYTSFRFTQHLIDAGIDASVGTVGDALDNALAESTIGLYKTELIKPHGPWHSKREVETATAAWVEWYNNQRLHEACSHRPPTEFEALYEQGDLASLVA